MEIRTASLYGGKDCIECHPETTRRPEGLMEVEIGRGRFILRLCRDHLNEFMARAFQVYAAIQETRPVSSLCGLRLRAGVYWRVSSDHLGGGRIRRDAVSHPRTWRT